MRKVFGKDPAIAWLELVSSEPSSMRQRKYTVIDRWPGGIEHLIAEAKSRGVHLLEPTDDRGDKLIAASKHPFKLLA